jgi:hypothetical protein
VLDGGSARLRLLSFLGGTPAFAYVPPKKLAVAAGPNHRRALDGIRSHDENAIWPLAMPHSWQLEAQMAPTLQQSTSVAPDVEVVAVVGTRMGCLVGFYAVAPGEIASPARP